MKKEKISTYAFYLSIVTTFLAAIVSVFQANLWLAGTQWILISIILGVWALYLKKQ